MMTMLSSERRFHNKILGADETCVWWIDDSCFSKKVEWCGHYSFCFSFSCLGGMNLFVFFDGTIIYMFDRNSKAHSKWRGSIGTLDFFRSTLLKSFCFFLGMESYICALFIMVYYFSLDDFRRRRRLSLKLCVVQTSRYIFSITFFSSLGLDL